MNFFEHQDQARRNTFRLVLLFCLAIVAITAAIYLVVIGVVHMREKMALERMPGGPFEAQWVWWRPQWIGATALGTTLVILFGSAMKIAQLSGGGSVVAEMMGGRLVPAETRKASEQRLRNVVEEMALASGVPVPQIYVMEFEDGINAFAAGYSPNDAAIAVTRGCLMTMNRDELQGVIAHEFSHILNGDMRLNIRLMGVLNGILIIGLLGETLLRLGGRGAYVSSRHSRDRAGGGAVIAIGLAILVIGYLGVFFGRLIKAAVSRQREFLADASAVQFTRNPGGIVGALCKIGGYSRHARVEASAAEEASHMFFGNVRGEPLFFGAMTATHPPLPERIRRIDPSFDGEFPPVSIAPRGDGDDVTSAFSGATAEPVEAAARSDGVAVARPARLAEQVGHLTPAGQRAGAALLSAIPEALRHALHDPYGAVTVSLGLLLAKEPEVRTTQLDAIRRYGDDAMVAEVSKAAAAAAGLPRELHMPLIDLALPALRQMSAGQYRDFAAVVEELIRADQRISLFEFALTLVLRHALAAGFDPAGQRTEVYSYSTLGPHLAQILSALAYAGAREPAAARRAFETGVVQIKNARAQQIQLLAASDCRWDALEKAMETMTVTAPAIRKQVFEACAACVMADQQVTLAEGELLRAFAHAMDCPMPPWMALTDETQQ